ncbi:unnamed protein product [Xylocopa violacea]|uniref:Uncharacterized protein n=1 Tax=Xylocopa violacea TaxID=135666 RepID=A0ABP1NZR0_XYLVO
MRVFGRGWCTVYAVLCVCAGSTIAQSDNPNSGNRRIYEPIAVESRLAYREVADDEASREPDYHRKLIPIKAPRVDKNFAMYSLPLEPEAEMLPAHYTGVKPPGVDHMELRQAESRVVKVAPKVAQLNGYDGGGGAGVAYQAIVTGNDPSRGMSVQVKLIPIKAPRVDKNVVTYTLPLKPDAGTLPAHYAGVKPLGVDHRRAESKITKVVPKSSRSQTHDRAGGTRRTGSEYESEGGTSEGGREKSSSIEKAEKGDEINEKKKSQYDEAGGRRKSYDNQRHHSGYDEEEGGGSRGAKYHKNNNDHVDFKESGYRSVYHKDERKRINDYYGNDDHGGHSKKHGRYKEKYVSEEGRYNKGRSRDSGSDEGGKHKQGVTGKHQAAAESKGRQAHNDYDEYFKKFRAYGNQGDKNEAKTFGFGQRKAR